jgi:YfiH family protein
MAWYLVPSPSPLLTCADSLTRFPFVRHGVTLRGDPDQFNFSFTTAHDHNDVREARQCLCEHLGFRARDLIVPAQAHGATVAVVGPEERASGALSPDTAIPGCDALVTDTPGLLLGITAADCLPVFFLDPVHRAIGLAHSGWRGTAGRIAPHTLETMTRAFGTRPQDCLVAIGPGIGPDGYEVDAKVHDAFLPEDTAAPGVFSPIRPGHWALDMYAAVVHQLRAGGVLETHFDISPWRTHRDTGLFFSRRLVPGCPRMMAFFGLADVI